jgi:type VII secretion protein EccE
VEDRGQRVGVGADAGGWFVVLEVGAVDGVGVAAAAPVPLAALAGALQDDSAGVSALQLVTHTVPVTGAGLDPRVPCMASYRQLPGDGLGTFPAHRHTWLALRLDTGDAAAAALARGGGLDGVDRTLVASAGRTGTVLAGAGLHHRVLDSAALLDALDSSCGLGLHPGVPVDERWDAVSLAGVLHRTWAVSTWGHTGLLPQLCRAVAAETSVALVLGAPAEGQVTLRAMVRVMAPEAEMGAAAAALEQGAAMVGARLQRLDGEQAAGMYATAPTGGGPL